VYDTFVHIQALSAIYPKLGWELWFNNFGSKIKD